MALTQRWFPGPEPAQIPWLKNYKPKLAEHGPTVGISAGEITDTGLDIDFYVWLLETWFPQVKADMAAATAYKRAVGEGSGASVPLPAFTDFTGPPAPPAVRPPGVLKRLFGQVARIKAPAPGYTETIGQALGIIGVTSESTAEFPEFQLFVEDGGPGCQCVRIMFTKFGHDGVFIECRRNGGAWENIGIDMEKPYIDGRPLLAAGTAELREYRLRFWDGGEANGNWSPIQKANVGV